MPLDYAKPGGATVSIAVLKAEATGTRRGSLVVNPGGPGGSGVQYAAAADFIVSKQVRDATTSSGSTPAGSAPPSPYLPGRPPARRVPRCGPDPGHQGRGAGLRRQRQGLRRRVRGQGRPAAGARLHDRGGQGHGHPAGRPRVDPKLDYLGKSYGTFLGATYADLFPRKVGRFVLDGVVAPDLSSTQVNQGQAEGFETATRAYVADCVKGGGCPLGGSVDAGMQRLRDFLKQLDASPIQVDDPHVTALTEGWGSLGIAAAMYDQGSWGRLTQALQSAFQGNGDDLMTLADSYADRTSAGQLQRQPDAGHLRRQLPRPLRQQGPRRHYEGEAKAFRGKAPDVGAVPRLEHRARAASGRCRPTTRPKKITAAGSGPIVVVGTTRDPATPYAWAKRLADQLAQRPPDHATTATATRRTCGAAPASTTPSTPTCSRARCRPPA